MQYKAAFLALDESQEGNHITLSCICVPLELIPTLEKLYITSRIKNRVWGEVKWSKITDTYLEKYKELINVYLSNSEVTLHTWSYIQPPTDEIRNYYDGKPGTVIYKQAYLLIRSVIRKCVNSSFADKFYIVPDATGKLGKEQYQLTQQYLIQHKSQIVSPNGITIDYCSPGDSQVCGAIQIADITAGAVRHCYNQSQQDPSCANSLVEYLNELNEGIPINQHFPRLPKLTDFKIHHCKFDSNLAGR